MRGRTDPAHRRRHPGLKNTGPRILAALLFCLLLTPLALAQTDDPPIAALLAKLMLSHELGVEYHLISLESVERVEWPDACLGLEVEGRLCAQALTPGYRIGLTASGDSYTYRADLSGVTIARAPQGSDSELSPLTLDGLEAGAEIASPLQLRGEAPGNWFFEAEFPVRLLDADGAELAAGVARAQGEWMTTEQVPFRVELEFEVAEAQAGTVVLQKANPSDLPENAAERRLPVTLVPAD